ncbi:MAG TPA: hypothetical protein VGR87_05230 [Candidatus Limnocylindria bacterium]|nr:hypothetical protein [Candidatus Limnocylindria bacterium]
MSETRAWGTLALFVFGMVIGVAAHQFAERGPGENPYPSLPKTDEPAAAHHVVAAIAADDARSLSKLLSADLLGDLDSALRPIIDVRGTKFVGAVESEGRLLSAYVATGKTADGIDFVVGFVLRVANDQVVGVN